MKTFITITLIALFLSFPGYGTGILREDALAKEYWDVLNASTKPVFLAGFRHGAGQGFRADDIPKLIPLIDSFYKVPENRVIYLRFAIEICVMQMMDKPKVEIEQLTATSRFRSMTIK